MDRATRHQTVSWQSLHHPANVRIRPSLPFDEPPNKITRPLHSCAARSPELSAASPAGLRRDACLVVRPVIAAYMFPYPRNSAAETVSCPLPSSSIYASALRERRSRPILAIILAAPHTRHRDQAGYTCDASFGGVGPTVEFIDTAHRWFVLMDVSNCTRDIQQNNGDSKQFESASDERLLWLETSFLDYLISLWHNRVAIQRQKNGRGYAPAGRGRLWHGPSGCKRIHTADEALAGDSATEPDYSRPQPLLFDKMEATRKRRLAAMAVVLSEIDEDFDLFPRKRSCWRKDWMGRKELGVQNLLYEELLKTDLDEYRRLLRVSREQFLQLLSRVDPRIRREDTVMRRSISAETRLQVTLRYLASADDAFPMRRNLMKPFGGTNLTEDKKIFNYRLSRARRVVENAFGILANRFRCLHTVINASPERVTAIVNAACVLHNFLGNDVISAPDLNVEPNPAASLLSGQAASRGRIGAVGAAVRDKLSSFFNDMGAVPWQRQFAHLDVSIYRKPRK
ncbi:hypothetical protein HPB49_022942 [Dermacentor silvarum]|uniref:Uncharacterized protein n=1 Tax=Dermacentor silvarum TaxID=543639 RepID=A0ACB8E3N3_DERSI|nr:hypothetical protein HPB49_022942 [Dermacentor silvarum]